MNDSLWLTLPEVARMLSKHPQTVRDGMRKWNAHEAEYTLPDRTVIRFYRRGRWWFAKSADLVPSAQRSKPRRRTKNPPQNLPLCEDCGAKPATHFLCDDCWPDFRFKKEKWRSTNDR